MWRENVEERDKIKKLKMRKGRRNVRKTMCKYEAV